MKVFNDTENTEGALSLGEELRKRREELGMTADALARVISTSPKYVRALEDGECEVFGAKVYARGVLKKMLAVVAPPARAAAGGADSESFIRLLDEEWDLAQKEKSASSRNAASGRQKNMYLTPTRAGIGVVAAVLAAFAFFAAGRLVRFNGRPLLVVDEPQDRAALREQTVWLKGRTEQESKLTVNGREITINEWGNFGERIELQPGATELIFLSENRFGKSSTVTRHVIVE